MKNPKSRRRRASSPTISLATALLAVACIPRVTETHPTSGRSEEDAQVRPDPAANAEAEGIPEPAQRSLAPTRPLANLTVLSFGSANPADPVHAVGTSPVQLKASDADALGLSGPKLDGVPLPDEHRDWMCFRNGEFTRGLGRPRSAIDPDHVSAERLQAAAWDWACGTTTYSRSARTGVSLSESSRGDWGDPSYKQDFRATASEDGRLLWERSTDRAELWLDGERGYLDIHPWWSESKAPPRTLEAFDLYTGKSSWSMQLPNAECGIVSNEKLIVIEDPKGHRVVDAASGVALAPFPATKAVTNGEDGDCSILALTNESLYVIDGDWLLHAFDIEKRELEWTFGPVDQTVLTASHDAVYVAAYSGQVLLAIDAQTGAQQARIGVGDMAFSVKVEEVGGATGPLVVLRRDKSPTDWVLGRSDVAQESFVIVGRLPADEDSIFGGLDVCAGDICTTTDDDGHFEIRGRGAGVMWVGSAAGPADAPYQLEQPELILDGRGRYDLGDVDAYYDGVFD